MTPVDFVLDVLLMEKPRMVDTGDLAAYSLPFGAPFFCNDWTTFLFQALNPDRFLGGAFVDLHTLLVDQLDVHARMYSVPAHISDPSYTRTSALYRAMHAAMVAAAPSQPSPVASWEEFVCLLAQCMDMASHIRGSLCGDPVPPQQQRFVDGQAGLYVEMLVAACAANRQLSWLACLREGRGMAPEPAYRIPAGSPLYHLPDPGSPTTACLYRAPHPDSGAYLPAALHPFGYDFLPFSMLHPPAEEAPVGPEHPSAGGSLFKHGLGGAGAAETIHAAPGQPPAPPAPPIWDHSVFLPAPPHPLPGHVGAPSCVDCCPRPPRRGPDEQPGGAAPDSAGLFPFGAAGQAWGGAGEDARHASHFIPGAQGGGRAHGGWDRAGGGPAPAPLSPGLGPLPAGGEGGQCPVRWASVVAAGGQPQQPASPPAADPWPPLASAGVVGQRRRREDDDRAGAWQRARF